MSWEFARGSKVERSLVRTGEQGTGAGNQSPLQCRLLI